MIIGVSLLFLIVVPGDLFGAARTVAKEMAHEVCASVGAGVGEAVGREWNLDIIRSRQHELEVLSKQIGDLSISMDASSQELIADAVVKGKKMDEPDAAAVHRSIESFHGRVKSLNVLREQLVIKESGLLELLKIQRPRVKNIKYTMWGMGILVAALGLVGVYCASKSSDRSSTACVAGGTIAVGGAACVIGGCMYSAPRTEYYAGLAESLQIAGEVRKNPKNSGDIEKQLVLARALGELIQHQDATDKEVRGRFEELTGIAQTIKQSLAEGAQASAQQHKEIMDMINNLVQARNASDVQLKAIHKMGEETAAGVADIGKENKEMKARLSDLSEGMAAVRADGRITQEELKGMREGPTRLASDGRVTDLQTQVERMQAVATSTHVIADQSGRDVAGLRAEHAGTSAEMKEAMARFAEEQAVLKEVALRSEQNIKAILELLQAQKPG